jgi:PIN domain nuclease of toxin-antitoxin system
MNIKYSLGKLDLKESPEKIFEIIERSNIGIMPIEPPHILESGRLPFHHRDPFDRMIIAQARVENLIIASRDKIFTEYEVNCIWGN